MNKENIQKENILENIDMEKAKKCERRRKKIIPFLIILNFLFLGHLMTFSILNKHKLDSLIEINNNKNQRTCDNYSKEVMKNIIANENKTGKIISSDKEKDLLKLKIKCLYNNGYNVNFNENSNKNIKNK